MCVCVCVCVNVKDRKLSQCLKQIFLSFLTKKFLIKAEQGTATEQNNLNPAGKKKKKKKKKRF